MPLSLSLAISPLLLRGSQECGWPFFLDWLHPEANRLEIFIIATSFGMVDLVSGDIGTRSGTHDPGQVNEFGVSDAYFDGNNDNYYFSRARSAVPIDTSQDFTIVWEIQVSGFIDATATIAMFPSSSGNAARLVYDNSTAADIALVTDETPLTRVSLPASVAMADRHWGVWSYAAGVGHRVWINGESCTDNGTHSLASMTDSVRVGGGNGSVDDFFGAIRQVRLYRRAWSVGEAFAFWNPSTRDGILRSYRNRPILVGDILATADGVSVASGSAQLSASYALAAVGVSVASGTASLTAGVSLSAAGASFSSGSAGVTALVSISAAGLAEAAGQAGLSSATFLAASGAAQASGNAALAARLEALAAGAAESSGSASLLATLNFSASGGALASGSADLQSVVAISADGFVEAMGAGTLWLRVDLAAAGAATASGSAGIGLLLGAVLIPDSRYVARLARRAYRVALPTP